MLNMQRATQQALDNLEVAIVVVDLEGHLEVVTKAAQDALSLKAGCSLQECKHPWMDVLAHQTMESGKRKQLGQGDYLVQVFVGGQEKFFRPENNPKPRPTPVQNPRRPHWPF